MNSKVTCEGVAFSCEESAGRIGSTSPIPMNDTTQANATAHTARGCRKALVVELADINSITTLYK